MNPPERHLQAVPDEFDGRAAISEWAGNRAAELRAKADALASGTPDAGQQAEAMARINDHVLEADVPKMQDAVFIERMQDRIDREVAGRVRSVVPPRSKPAPGPFAHVHAEGYRRMGMRRKRQLKVYRLRNEPGLTVARGAYRERRRVVRAARG